MKKNIIIIIIIITSFCLASCETDRIPYSAMESGKIVGDPDGSLEALLNGSYAQMKVWSDVMHRTGEYAGDNIMIRGTSTDAFYEFISYSRTPNNYRLQAFWDNGYKIIAQSSNIIKMLKEGVSSKVDHNLGECYFLRGMMYFYLTRAYGRPYYQSAVSNLGVPIVNGTPEDMMNLQLPDRATVKESYKQAILDLEKAITLLDPDDNSKIRASQGVAKALLSRVYLYMSGTYENPNTEYAQKAVKYADEVINSGKYELLPRAEFMKYNTYKPENNKETIFAIKRVASEFSGYAHYYGIGGMYANIGGMGWGEMYASAKYIDLLEETGRNDWFNGKIVDARASFIEPQYVDGNEKVFRFIKNVYNKEGKHTNFNYVQAAIKQAGNTIECTDGEKTYRLKALDKEQGIYSIVYEDGETYKGVIDQKMKLNRVYPMFYITKASREGEESHLHSPLVTRLAEMYLNKAEALAKLGSYGEALAALNIVRERSLPGKGYVALEAKRAGELIDKERQLELAYQAERSYDVFRNGGKLTRFYPGPHNAMEVIEPTDYRVVYFIPQKAINAYPGKLTQNPTE